MYFDEAHESSFTYGATADVECTEYIVQQVSMETIRATYEHHDHSRKVQKFIAWESMHVTDKMKESFMADICTSY